MNTQNEIPRVVRFVLAASLLLIPVSAFSVTEQEELEIIREGLRYRHDAVQTLKGSFQTTHWSAGKKIAESTTSGIFDGKRFRISFSTIGSSPSVIEGLFDGTNTTEWFRMSTNQRAQVLPGLSGLTAVQAREFDPRNHVISRLAEDTNLNIVGRETLDGDTIVISERTVPKVLPDANDSLIRLRVNISKGFTVPEVDIYAVGEGGRSSLAQKYECEYKDHGNGMWVLSKYVVLSYDEEGREHSRKITKWSSDFQINVPTDGHEFGLVVPSGLTVYDQVLDEEYVVP